MPDGLPIGRPGDFGTPSQTPASTSGTTSTGIVIIDRDDPSQVNDFHTLDDTDVAEWAHHHTLGPSKGQAASGFTFAHHTHLGIVQDGSTPLNTALLTGIILTNQDFTGLSIEEILDYPGRQNSVLEYCWDFFDSLNGTPFGDSLGGAGTSNAASAPLDTNHQGIVTSSTGTTATGRAGLFNLSGASIRLGGGQITVECIVRIPVLSTVGEEFIVRVGLNDNPGADVTDGVFFEYDRLNSLNWRMATAANSVRTKTNTTTAVTAATWYRLTMVINPAANSVEYFIDGVSVGTIVATIPTGAGRETSMGFNIQKSAGVTARTLLTDKVYFRQALTTPR
jgi:hypothetical protein